MRRGILSDFLNWWKGSIQYVNTSNLLITEKAPLSDEDIERINIDFVRKVRETVRWMGANNTDLSSIVNANKMGIIGSGINIQSRIPNAPNTNNALEDFISEWSEIGNCEVTGRWHFNGAMRSMVEFTDKDGGFLIKHHYNPDWNIPYRFELIEVGMIDIDKHDEKNNLLNGLQRDNFGKVVGVYLYTGQERKKSTMISTEDLTLVSPVWISLSQYTAVSKFASLLPSIDNLDRYTDAELKSAIERAKNGRYWGTTLYDDIINLARYAKDENDKRSNIAELLSKIGKMGIKPSGLTPIPAGDTIYDNKGTSDTIYNALTDQSKQNISSSQGLSSQIVYQDPSKSNYSAIKAMMEFANVQWSTRWDDLYNMAIKPIERRLLRAAADKGVLPSDFYLSPRKYSKLEYMRVVNIDIEPVKSANANKINLELGLTSPRAIARAKGRNIEDIYRERIEDEIAYEKMKKEAYSKAGLEIPTQNTIQLENGVQQ